MRRDILNKQFELDFPDTDLTTHAFSNAAPNNSMRYWARSLGSIVIYKGLLYCRVHDNDLIRELETQYHACDAEWFGEVSNLKRLEQTLKPYGATIINYAPFFTPSAQFTPYENDTLTFYEADEIPQFKGIEAWNQCYCYDEENPDLLGVSYSENGVILGMAGLNKTGQYALELGINVTPELRGRGLATKLIKAITTRAHECYPDYVITYGTQFTHTQSINVAINAGFTHAWTEIMIGELKGMDNRSKDSEDSLK